MAASHREIGQDFNRIVEQRAVAEPAPGPDRSGKRCLSSSQSDWRSGPAFTRDLSLVLLRSKD